MTENADRDSGIALPWLEAPLKDALQRTRAHAVLVHGPAGVGQYQFGLALAQAWLCEAEQGARPCGACTSCRLMRSRSHPDFFLLAPEALRDALGWPLSPDDEARRKDRKPSKDIRVDEVREAIAWSQRSSTRGRAKVLLIHPAPAMNAVTANALLKTLEEPPGAMRVILSANDPEDLLPTIRSRCQRIALSAPSRALSLAWLRAQGVVDAEALLAAAGGLPQQALALSRDGFDGALWAQLPGMVRRGDARALVGRPVPAVVSVLQKICHDLMAVAAGALPLYFGAASLPHDAALDRLAEWSHALVRARRHDEHPWHAALAVEALVAQGRAVWHAAPPAQAQRLATLPER